MALRTEITDLIDSQVPNYMSTDEFLQHVELPYPPNDDEIAYLRTKYTAARAESDYRNLRFDGGDVTANRPLPVDIRVGHAVLEVNLDRNNDEVTVYQPTHDALNANVNLQVGNADVANANPVPVSDAAGSLTVDQETHDNLNANANMQVGNADVANGNPVPVSDAGGTLTVDQGTHDNLNANANLQVGDADVDAANPVNVLDTNSAAMLAAQQDIETAVELIDDVVGTIGANFSGKVAVVGGQVESTIPDEEDDTDAAPLWLDPFRRLVIAGYDLGEDALGVIDRDPALMATSQPGGQDTLTDPGDGDVDNVEDFHHFTYQAVVDIGGCTDIVVRVDGSLDGTSYGVMSLDSTAVANAAYTNNLVTISASGTYLLIVKSTKAKYLKPVFVSETDDTDATVTFTPMFGN